VKPNEISRRKKTNNPNWRIREKRREISYRGVVTKGHKPGGENNEKDHTGEGGTKKKKKDSKKTSELTDRERSFKTDEKKALRRRGGV